MDQPDIESNNSSATQEKRIRILMVLPGYPRMENGMPSYATWLVDSLRQQHEITVLVPAKTDGQRLSYRCEQGVDIFTLRIPDPVSSQTPVKALLAWLRDIPSTIFELKKLLSERKIQVVHTTFHSYNYVFRLIRFLGGPRYLVTLHGSETFCIEEIPRPYQKLARFVVQGADQVVSVSDALGEIARQKFDNLQNLCTIYNGIDTTIQNSDEPLPPLSIGLPKRYCLLVARLHPVKGVDIAIRAWQHVIESEPDVHLLIAGDGSELDNCEKLIIDSRTQNRVHLLGSLENPVVRKLMSKAEALILSSRSEGLGLVCLEAGLASLPVVATRVGGVPEIIDEGISGFLAPSENPEALAERVKELLHDPGRRKQFGQQLGNKVRTIFDSTSCARKYVDLYQETISSRK